MCSLDEAKIREVRKTIAQVIAEYEQSRTGAPPKKCMPRKSLLDPLPNALPGERSRNFAGN